MVKSGSSLLLHYTLNVVAAVTPKSGQEAFRALIRAGELNGVGDYVRDLGPRVIDRLSKLSKEEGPIVVKTHYPLDKHIGNAIRGGDAVSIFTIRDPRDIVLSAIDHRARSQFDSRPLFGRFVSIDESIEHIMPIVRSAIEWKESGLACIVRYEDLVTSPVVEIGRVGVHVGFVPATELIESIVDREVRDRSIGRNQFNRGEVIRYKNEMSLQQIQAYNSRLKESIDALGY